MSNVLVTGAKGQLGSEIQYVVKNNSVTNHYFFTDVYELDITQKQQIENYILQNKIDVIINCAAYTQVDKAEDDIEMADLLNHIAVKNLAEVAKDGKILIHISTDYVFDGNHHVPLLESDKTNPIGVYGRTKLNGEKAVQEISSQYMIIRTSWLYSSFGNNFVKTMIRLTGEKDQLKVVFDQVGTPTYARDLADFIVEIIENDSFKNKKEVYHFSNEGVCSWYDFALTIRDAVGNSCDIKPCHSDEFPSKVKRPHYSVLDKTKAKKHFNTTIPYWKDSLTACITLLKKKNEL